MLDEYEADHNTGMDTAEIAKQIRAYTNGYPFLSEYIDYFGLTTGYMLSFNFNKNKETA